MKLRFLGGTGTVTGSRYLLSDDKHTLLVFWAKWDKANFHAYEKFADVAAKHADALNVICVSTDPEKSYAEGMLTKEKYAEPGQHLKKMNVAWDANKTVASAYKEVMEELVINLPHAFLINKSGIVVWHEIFRANNADCKLMAQIDRLVAGEEMELSNGPTPVIEDDSDSDSDGGAEVDDDFELF